MSMIALGLFALAAAQEPNAEAAITKYCEPLAAGAAVAKVEPLLTADGFKPAVVGGQPVWLRGETIVGLSDNPRVCLVQAPRSMTLAEGMALTDAWAKRRPDAVRSPATIGPDGAPVRGYTSVEGNAALVASHQTTASGQKVMTFILMPLPKAVRN